MKDHIRGKPSKRLSKLPRLLYRWHRRIGAAAAAFLLWIVVSGWLLNHSDGLNLAQRHIQSAELASWYNLYVDPPNKAFVSEHHWLIGNILNGKKITTSLEETLGIAETENFVAIASHRDIVLLSSSGELVDKLSDASLPLKNISKIGSGCSGIAITDGNLVLATNDGLEWQPCALQVAWSIQQEISAEQHKQVESLLVPEISLEKIIVDLHSGRFFGTYGAYVVDAVGLCLALLALSGLWLFLRGVKK